MLLSGAGVLLSGAGVLASGAGVLVSVGVLLLSLGLLSLPPQAARAKTMDRVSSRANNFFIGINQPFFYNLPSRRKETSRTWGPVPGKDMPIIPYLLP